MEITEEELVFVCVRLSTCCSDGLPVLLFIALIEVVHVADVCGFDAHQAGQTLHVFITEEQGHEWTFIAHNIYTQIQKKHLKYSMSSFKCLTETLVPGINIMTLVSHHICATAIK